MTTAELETIIIQLQEEIDEIREALIMLLLEAKRHGWILSVEEGGDINWKV